MSVGQQATAGTISSQLTTQALALRATCQQIRDLQTFIVTLGTAGLEASGFSSADAATAQQMASYLNTVAGVYFGTAVQASDFDFDNALSGLWAAQ